MRWEDERYVRLYTRDTIDWLSLSFIAQGLFCLILRKVDRAGLMKLGKHGKRAVAVMVGFPGDWPRLEPALEELVADGSVEIRGDHLLVPNFIEAQEATQTDAQRKRESRAKARDIAAAQKALLADNLSVIVTECHKNGQNVRDSHAAVTTCHSPSQVVTPNCAVPSLAEPCLAEPPAEEAPPPTRIPSLSTHLEGQCPNLAALLKATAEAGFRVEPGRLATRWGEADALVEQVTLDAAVPAVVEAAPRSRGYPGAVPLAFIASVLREAAGKPSPPKPKDDGRWWARLSGSEREQYVRERAEIDPELEGAAYGFEGIHHAEEVRALHERWKARAADRLRGMAESVP